ncbi:MAG: hypothetical protein ICV84_23005 [Flavisolibacter sp.]|nr:hypothetical protein [Flavisolibacter sp.]
MIRLASTTAASVAMVWALFGAVLAATALQGLAGQRPSSASLKQQATTPIDHKVSGIEKHLKDKGVDPVFSRGGLLMNKESIQSR